VRRRSTVGQAVRFNDADVRLPRGHGGGETVPMDGDTAAWKHDWALPGSDDGEVCGSAAVSVAGRGTLHVWATAVVALCLRIWCS